MKNHNKALYSLLITGFSLLALQTAQAQDQTVTVVAPACLTNKLTVATQTLATDNELSLITVNQQGLKQLIAAKHNHKQVCGGFFNVSDEWQRYQRLSTLASNSDLAKHFLTTYNPNKNPITKSAINGPAKYEIKYQKQVSQLLGTLNADNIWKNLTYFSSYSDRYAGSDNGVKAANWLKEYVEKLAQDNSRNDIHAYFIATGNRYKQPSLVVKLGTSNEPGVVLGAHMDTLNSNFSNKPGADDDGSGSMTLLQTAQTVIDSGMKFNKPLYFIWYSAEEMGLVGSQYVVNKFKQDKIPVAAVLQLDMTGYAYKNDPTIWLITDNVNRPLTAFLNKLIKTYVKQPVAYTTCGYACSDHASWSRNGYASSFPFEAKFGQDDPYIHTSNDKIDYLSLNHMADYAKLGIAFAVELAEPVQ
jgi:bacterial leucyl aminopeptidase